MAVLTALALASASPVAPLFPELPERAVGLPVAVAVALPVSPLLVEAVWAVAEPLFPLVAVGAALTVA